MIDKDTMSSLMPEGPSGTLEKDHEIIYDRNELGLLWRPVNQAVIDSLQNAKQNSFLHSKSEPYIFLGNDSNDRIIILFFFLSNDDCVISVFCETDGENGCGKSSVITSSVLWARKNGWLVVYLPEGRAWLDGSYITESSIRRETFGQPEYASLLAGFLISAHGEQLKNIPLKTKFDLQGFQR
jgi:hypothetical protein